MLARSGLLPTSGDYAYELKWDGFRSDRLDRGAAACRATAISEV
jgi:hypothetical protein